MICAFGHATPDRLDGPPLSGPVLPPTPSRPCTGELMSLVEKEHHGDVVVIRMNRPDKLNAMNKQLLTELALAFTDFREDPAQKIAILTGTGRAFCAGEGLV